MARMIPNRFDGRPSEKDLFAIFRDQLPDSYTVFYSVDWLRKTDRGAVHGESDFIIVSREHGLLVVEAKGGLIGCDAEKHEWWRQERDHTRKPIKDPVDQARNGVYALCDLLQKAGIPLVKRLCRAYAVCFPQLRRDQTMPGSALPREVILTSEDMKDLEKSLLRAWKHFGEVEGGLMRDERLWKAVLDTISPSFAITYSLVNVLDEDQRELIRLTTEQFTVLSLLREVKRAHVTGCAGSGKTLLAVEKSRRLSESGQSVLFLCFNRFLARDIGARLEDPSGRIVVHCFGTLCQEMVEKTGTRWTVPTDQKDLQRFWDSEAPEMLDRAVNALGSGFDAVVVDEAQDFLTRYWVSIENILKNRETSILYAFSDPGQNVFDRSPQYPAGLQVSYPLSYNCRNTRSISRLLQRVRQIEVPTRKEAPEGEEPRFFACESRGAQRRVVQDLVEELCVKEGLNPERVVILSCREAKHSAVGGDTSIGRIGLARNIFPCPAGKVLVTSLRRFKGLEADAVIITDIDASLPTATPVHIYVAASRARHRLFLVGNREAIADLQQLA